RGDTLRQPQHLYSELMEPSRTRWAGLVAAAVLAAGGTVGTWVCWRFFVDTRRGQLLDNAALEGTRIGHSTLWDVVYPILDVVSVTFVVVVVAIATIMAAIRLRWLRVVQIAVLVGGANITTQVLKQEVFERPDLADTIGSANNSLPSGHTTVAASVAAILLFAVPAWLRPLTALGGAAYTALTGVSTMVGGWHRPSDVVAAITVVIAWAGIASLITVADRPETDRVRGGLWTAVTVVVLGVAASLTFANGGGMLVRADQALATDPSLDDRSLLIDAYAGGALSVVAASAVAFALILLTHHLAAHRSRRRGSSTSYDRRQYTSP